MATERTPRTTLEGEYRRAERFLARCAELEARVATLTEERDEWKERAVLTHAEYESLRTRAEEAEREAATLRELLAAMLAPLEKHEVLLVHGACNVPGYETGVSAKWRGDSWPDMHDAAERARVALAGAGRSTEGEG